MSAALQIVLPDIGDYRDVPVIELLVKPGDRLAVDDLILSIESDKATMEVPSPVAGTVRELLVGIGSKVSEGTPILVVEPAEGGEAADAPLPPPYAGEGTLRSRGGEGQRDGAGFTPVATLPDTALPSPDPLRGPPSPAEGGGSARVAVARDNQSTAPTGDVHASPSVRQLARELGITLDRVPATGPKGRILREDLHAFVKAALQAPA